MENKYVLHRKNGKLYEFNERGEIVLTPSQKDILNRLIKEQEEKDA